MHKLSLAFLLATLSFAAQAQPVTNPAPVGIAAAYNSVAPTCTTGNFCWAQVDVNGNLKVTGTFTPSGSSPEFTPVAPATATATAGVLLGGQYDSTQKTLTNGQQAAASFSARGALFVAVGADGFATTSTAQAPVAPATATATTSNLIGCQATSAAINPTTSQQAAIDCDLNNNLLVSAGGAPNIATSQASVTTGNISAASARALRRAITITNVTGTSPVYCGNTGVTTSTGTYLGGTAGSSITLNTTAAVFCTVAATTQTVTVVETY